MSALIRVIAVMSMLFLLLGAGPARPDVPESLQPSADQDPILKSHAIGVQIYVCQANPAQTPAWVLLAPEADLMDASGAKIVHHSAGPAWKHIDGSEVTGKLVTKQDSPTSGAIPWLLLTAASHSGNGILSAVTSIQRINTERGMPPKAAECKAAMNGQQSRSEYSADYYFYAPAKK